MNYKQWSDTNLSYVSSYSKCFFKNSRYKYALNGGNTIYECNEE
jgi:hypothetical protein